MFNSFRKDNFTEKEMSNLFRKDNFTKEEKILLARSIPKNATFLWGIKRNGARKTIKGSTLVNLGNRSPEPEQYRYICEKIHIYQIRKLKLQQQLFTYDLESLPVEMLSFLMDEKSIKFQIVPIENIGVNPQETAAKDVVKVEYMIERQQRLQSMLRINILSEKMRQFFKAQKRISMMEQMKNNTKKWGDEDSKHLYDEFIKLDMLINTPNSKQEREKVEDEIIAISKDLKNVLQVTLDNNKLNKQILKNTETILTKVQELDLKMTKGFKKVLDRIDALEETLLSAIKQSKSKHILDNMFLTEKDKRGVWRYGIGELQPRSFTGDSDELYEFWDWNEFQSPLIAWNAFFRVVFYNSYRAISAMVTNLFGGRSEFTATLYFQEFGQAISIWISAIAKLIFSAVKNISMAVISVINLDFKSFMTYGAKLAVSMIMAFAGEVMVGWVAGGAMGTTLAIFSSSLVSTVKGVHSYAFHSICSIAFSCLDMMLYSFTGYTTIGNGSYDSFLYTQLRLGIDAFAEVLYNLMPKYPGSDTSVSLRGLLGTIIRSFIDACNFMYTQYIYWLGTPKPVQAIKTALKEVAENPSVDVKKVVETAQCASKSAIQNQLETVKQYYADQQSWGDWFKGEPLDLPADLKRYFKWEGVVNMSVAYNNKEFVMSVVTYDGKTLLMLKDDRENLYTMSTAGENKTYKLKF